MNDDADKKKPKKPAQPRKKATKKVVKKKAAPKRKAPKKKSSSKKVPIPRKSKEERLDEAIKTHFSGVRGRLNARFLWEADGRKRYRCNWIDYEGHMEHSEFIQVIEKNGEFEIIPQTYHPDSWE